MVRFEVCIRVRPYVHMQLKNEKSDGDNKVYLTGHRLSLPLLSLAFGSIVKCEFVFFGWPGDCLQGLKDFLVQALTVQSSSGGL